MGNVTVCGCVKGHLSDSNGLHLRLISVEGLPNCFTVTGIFHYFLIFIFKEKVYANNAYKQGKNTNILLLYVFK